MDAGAATSMIDTDRYPVDRLEGGAGQDLLARMREELAVDGATQLPAFLRADALARLAAEAEALVPLAWRGPAEASPYFYDYRTEASARLPADHPRRLKTPRRLSQVACDLIPKSAGIRRLYEWNGLAAFLAAALGEARLYRSADPYQALNISVMEAGGCQQWHFDTSECVITLLLQAPEGGGAFEYAPAIRSEDDENFDAVRAVMLGSRDRVRTVAPVAGTLMLFRGRFSLHRVTPVTGPRRRLQTIFGFNPRPGVVGTLETNVLHYGPRVAARS